jgi:hypothetical protein
MWLHPIAYSSSHYTCVQLLCAVLPASAQISVYDVRKRKKKVLKEGDEKENETKREGRKQ